jgi:eukaryotic-like serine/threonine-protein kinase
VTTASTAPIGVVAHFNLLERLEPSGPGELFRARDTHRGRTVAIRLLPPDYLSGIEARHQLLADARALVALSHPNITTLFDVGEHGAQVYVAFEFVRGRSLRSEMANRPMNPRRALELAIQITDAVAEAHSAGFSHRGLSPESIIVTEKGHAKIPTFHLASLVGFDSAAGDMALMDYRSPEEERGESPDDRSDVYSVAAISYEMVTTRRPPLRGASAPSVWNPGVPKELDDVLLKALAANPESRSQSAAALAAELRAVTGMLSTRDEHPDDDEWPREPASSSRPMLAAAVVLLLLVALAWWFMRS